MRLVGIVGPLGVKVDAGAIVAVSVAVGVGTAVPGAHAERRNKNNRKPLNNFIFVSSLAVHYR